MTKSNKTDLSTKERQIGQQAAKMELLHRGAHLYNDAMGLDLKEEAKAVRNIMRDLLDLPELPTQETSVIVPMLQKKLPFMKDSINREKS